jgi:5-methylcytosine-specific restriction endonuclease McrA
MADPHRPAYLQDDDDPTIKWWPLLQSLHWRGFIAVRLKQFGFMGIKRRPGRPTRVYIPSEFIAELRARAYKRSRKRCIYCRERVYLQYAPSKARVATLEHRTPLARGGTWKKSNLGCACMRCNTMKGDMTDSEFRAIIIKHGFGDHRLRNAAKAAHREQARIRNDEAARKREAAPLWREPTAERMVCVHE